MELVRRKGQHVYIHFVDVYVKMTCRLDCVRMEQHLFLAADRADLGDRLNCANFVVREHYAYKRRVVSDGVGDLSGGNSAL